MDQDCKNPCDLCKKQDLCRLDYCALSVYSRKCECTQYQCFLNYEGSCMIGLYENCGAWEGGANNV